MEHFFILFILPSEWKFVLDLIILFDFYLLLRWKQKHISKTYFSCFWLLGYHIWQQASHVYRQLLTETSWISGSGPLAIKATTSISSELAKIVPVANGSGALPIYPWLIIQMSISKRHRLKKQNGTLIIQTETVVAIVEIQAVLVLLTIFMIHILVNQLVPLNADL